MIPAIVVALLALAALVYVAGPIRRRGARGVVDDAPDARSALEERRDAALEALVDLEEEADMGKLDQREMAALRDRYEREALEALAALDSVDLVSATDPLEAEIAAMRERLTCPSCGAPREPGTRCARCGA
jgi:hypothetical protein